ncbi:MAG TPA: ribosome maturation factor RimM [Pseudogracilibacillus sp.]|nr:ribosome maturation factor RimM [Pseudogracilibacillus sp.]
MFIVGEIVNTHGINGEVKVKRLTDFEERFFVGNTVYLYDNDSILPLTIDGFRTRKNMDYLCFENYTSINDVEQWKGSYLYIYEEQLTPLEENAFYYHEIIGCTVYTTENVVIGKVTSILAPGANDVWVAEDEQGKEYLIPYIADVVKKINIKDKEIIIERMEGLFE